MAKKVLCLSGCIIHFICVISIFIWVIVFKDLSIPHRRAVIFLDILFILLCIFIGVGIFRLDIDKLFLKYEIEDFGKWERVAIFIFSNIAIGILLFEIGTVLLFFFEQTKMSWDEFVRFTVLPSLALIHLGVGSGGYLAFQYFNTF